MSKDQQKDFLRDHQIMEAYDVGDMKFVKKGAGGVTNRVVIENACLSIFGTIQPEVLCSVFRGANQSSGFTGRFLYSMIPSGPTPEWENEGVGDYIGCQLKGFATYLLKLSGKNGQPLRLTMSPESRSLYTDWFNSLTGLHNAKLLSIITQNSNVRKIQDQVARLAVNLHYLEQFASGGTSSVVLSDSMLGAIFLGEYFRKEYEKMIFASCNHKPKKNDSIVELLSAIVRSKDKVVDGKLATSVICDTYNDSKSDSYKISSDSMGRHLGKTVNWFPRYRVGNRGPRGVKVTEQSILRAHNQLSEYHSVFNV